MQQDPEVALVSAERIVTQVTAGLLNVAAWRAIEFQANGAKVTVTVPVDVAGVTLATQKKARELLKDLWLTPKFDITSEGDGQKDVLTCEVWVSAFAGWGRTTNTSLLQSILDLAPTFMAKLQKLIKP